MSPPLGQRVPPSTGMPGQPVEPGSARRTWLPATAADAPRPRGPRSTAHSHTAEALLGAAEPGHPGRHVAAAGEVGDAARRPRRTMPPTRPMLPGAFAGLGGGLGAVGRPWPRRAAAPAAATSAVSRTAVPVAVSQPKKADPTLTPPKTSRSTARAFSRTARSWSPSPSLPARSSETRVEPVESWRVPDASTRSGGPAAVLMLILRCLVFGRWCVSLPYPERPPAYVVPGAPGRPRRGGQSWRASPRSASVIGRRARRSGTRRGAS